MTAEAEAPDRDSRVQGPEDPENESKPRACTRNQSKEGYRAWNSKGDLE